MFEGDLQPTQRPSWNYKKAEGGGISALATALGNKLTAIGVYWDGWKHSSFFALLATMSLVMSLVLTALLRPGAAMPGV